VEQRCAVGHTAVHPSLLPSRGLHADHSGSATATPPPPPPPPPSHAPPAQAYFQLRSSGGNQLRGFSDSSQSKVFSVSFEGESGIDAGGVYREGISRVVDDLFSDRFNLLIKTPNARKGYKINTNSYVPNPAHRTPLALSMLEFCGRFMGLSLRSKACLPFEFPSLVWKGMVGERTGLNDLMAIDATFAEFLTRLRDCDSESTTNDGALVPAIRSEEAFAAAYPGLRFTAINTTGVIVSGWEPGAGGGGGGEKGEAAAGVVAGAPRQLGIAAAAASHERTAAGDGREPWQCAWAVSWSWDASRRATARRACS
jgi:hypothetical protein